MRGASLSVALHAAAIVCLALADQAPPPLPSTVEVTVALLPPAPMLRPVAVEPTAQPAAPQTIARTTSRSRAGPAAAPPSPAPPSAQTVSAATAESAAASPGLGETAAAAETATSAGPTREALYELGAADTPLPDYPWSARRRNREGRVVVRLMVAADGSVQLAEVLESSGDLALDEAARDTLSKWRLHPALNNGTPMATHIDVPIRFELRQQARL